MSLITAVFTLLFHVKMAAVKKGIFDASLRLGAPEQPGMGTAREHRRKRDKLQLHITVCKILNMAYRWVGSASFGTTAMVIYFTKAGLMGK